MLKKVLITVLTYPTPSTKYIETVCTAGITEDGDWIRIYPIKLRMLREQIHKYSWYIFDVEKRAVSKDFRKESHFWVHPERLECLGKIGTTNFWEERKKYCLKKVFYNYANLEKASNFKTQNFLSLATFKPREIINLVARPKDIQEEQQKKIEILENLNNQGELIEREDIPEYWEMAQSIPYRFYYQFKDDEDNEIKLMIEDWEINMLFLKCLNGESGKDAEKEAIKKVKQKYLLEFKNKDIYFFMGTRYQDHIKNRKKYFSIIGVFYPEKKLQLTFDL